MTVSSTAAVAGARGGAPEQPVRVRLRHIALRLHGARIEAHPRAVDLLISNQPDKQSAHRQAHSVRSARPVLVRVDVSRALRAVDAREQAVHRSDRGAVPRSPPLSAGADLRAARREHDRTGAAGPDPARRVGPQHPCRRAARRRCGSCDSRCVEGPTGRRGVLHAHIRKEIRCTTGLALGRGGVLPRGGSPEGRRRRGAGACSRRIGRNAMIDAGHYGA
jgi:hypothetical protein